MYVDFMFFIPFVFSTASHNPPLANRRANPHTQTTAVEAVLVRSPMIEQIESFDQARKSFSQTRTHTNTLVQGSEAALGEIFLERNIM